MGLFVLISLELILELDKLGDVFGFDPASMEVTGGSRFLEPVF